MPKKIVAGNWKMNKDQEEVNNLLDDLQKEMLELPQGVEVVVSPAFPFLASALAQSERTPFQIAAQNCHEANSGAFTGEVSVPMLKSLGVSYCIVGHSERRQYYNESDDAVGLKMKALLEAGITPIYCCGEQKDDRESGKHFDVVGAQISASFSHLNSSEKRFVVVAYEPVWAIGTGLTASAEQAQEMHAFIRKHLGQEGAEMSILYGGSCKPANADELFSCKDVDGGLIGGAALNASDFLELVRILNKQKNSA